MIAAPLSLAERIRQKDFLLGSFVFSTDPSVTEVYGSAGFDFVIVDMEHGLNDLQSTVNHLRAARASGLGALVRVGATTLGDVPRLLDAGCEGIVIPHLGLSGSGAHEALQAVRYAPTGTRPTCTGVSAADFGIGAFASYVERANRDVITVGLVEDRECVERMDEILAREPVNWVMPGPGDLATSLGVPGQLRHPKVEAAVDQVFSAAQRRQAPVGMYVNDPGEITAWRARGAKFIVLSIDLKWLGLSLRTAADACRSLVQRNIA